MGINKIEKAVYSRYCNNDVPGLNPSDCGCSGDGRGFHHNFAGAKASDNNIFRRVFIDLKMDENLSEYIGTDTCMDSDKWEIIAAGLYSNSEVEGETCCP